MTAAESDYERWKAGSESLAGLVVGDEILARYALDMACVMLTVDDIERLVAVVGTARQGFLQPRLIGGPTSIRPRRDRARTEGERL